MARSSDRKKMSENVVQSTERAAVNRPMRLDPIIPDNVELRVLSAIRKIIRSVSLYSRELKSKSQVTTPQLICLMAIVKNGPMTATTISREVFLSPSTIVGILDRLEQKGLVNRERSERDRRIVTVTATNAGLDLVAQSPSPLQESLKTRLQILPTEEQERIAESLEHVVALMEAHDIDGAPILEIGSIANKSPAEDKDSK